MKYLFLLLLILNMVFAKEKQYIYDKDNFLYWEDSLITKEKRFSWQEAKNYCKNLNLNDLKNWRLPSKNELISIIDENKVDPAINNSFKYTSSSPYWTSTLYEQNKIKAWAVYFFSGFSYYRHKNSKNYVRCVKNKN